MIEMVNVFGIYCGKYGNLHRKWAIFLWIVKQDLLNVLLYDGVIIYDVDEGENVLKCDSK